MEFRIGGPLEVWGPAETQINLASAEQRRLTSFLVQRANSIVGAETLEEHLGLTPGALRTSVSRLRRLVGFDALLTAPPGYMLRTDRIDAVQFEALVALARSSDDRTAARCPRSGGHALARRRLRGVRPRGMGGRRGRSSHGPSGLCP